jgi:CheY-like chemotaxis protein
MGGKIMIVDDDPSVRFAVGELLQSEGFETVSVAGGQDCVEEIGRGFKGVILMDIMMPGMDGWDTVKEIVDRGYLEGNIISMLTARDIEDQKREDVAPYVTGYVMKPLDPDELVTAVREYLRFVG